MAPRRREGLTEYWSELTIIQLKLTYTTQLPLQTDDLKNGGREKVAETRGRRGGSTGAVESPWEVLITALHT